jgi:hypothetical protein
VVLPGSGVPGAASVQPALRGAPLLAWVEGGGRITLPPPPPLVSLLGRHASTAATARGWSWCCGAEQTVSGSGGGRYPQGRPPAAGLWSAPHARRRANHERRRPQPSGTAVRDSSALHATTPSRPWVAAPEAAALGDSSGTVVGSARYGGSGGRKPSRTAAWSRAARGRRWRTRRGGALSGEVTAEVLR